MPDLEKVIRGLECCFADVDSYFLCERCPYKATDEDRAHLDWSCHKKELMRDALELLKAYEQNLCDQQECEPPCGGKENCEFRGMDGFCKAYQGPRVMTLEEAQKWVEIPLESRAPVFYEDRILERAWWIWNADDRNIYLPAIIGGIGRFWTSRPTDEQRRATPWN